MTEEWYRQIKVHVHETKTVVGPDGRIPGVRLHSVSSKTFFEAELPGSALLSASKSIGDERRLSTKRKILIWPSSDIKYLKRIIKVTD